ncbi:MAG: DUF3568 family protein [Proteobacteria bacterium]|nr:DUF3568 family protein [Pseudomonadota bacterium]
MMRLLAVVIVSCWLGGCAAGLIVAGAGTGVAMGTGVDHTLSGITYKTFTAPLGEVRQASLKTLRQMDMTVTDDRAGEGGWIIQAAATERTIDIELEKLTPNTTRMRCAVDKGGIFFKDAATATEIVTQTAQVLDERPLPASAKTARR